MIKDKGFSLIELVIVIAILGIVLAIAAPNFAVIRDNANLREAARKVSSDIQLYKQKAISENVRYVVIFSSGAQHYWILKETALNSWSWSFISTIDLGNAVQVTGTPSFSGGYPYVFLYPRGNTGMGSVVLKHKTRDIQLKITTTATGRVYVDKP